MIVNFKHLLKLRKGYTGNMPLNFRSEVKMRQPCCLFFVVNFLMLQ